MDSLSQLALGAAVSVAVMARRKGSTPTPTPTPRRTALWKAAAWGAVAGTLPDLDVLISHGDPILDMVLHRSETHALFWLALFSLPFGWLVAWLSGDKAHWRRWWAAMALALLTHPLLDAMTVYGTRLLLPFSDVPLGVGSIFIIDPLYTLPLLVGLAVALALRNRVGLRANAVGLALSTAYLGWSMAAQQHVAGVDAAALQQQGITAERVLVTPTPFNTVLWRVLAVAPDGVHEGFYSLVDKPGPLRFDRFARDVALDARLAAALSPQSSSHSSAQSPAQALRDFSRGFYRVDASADGQRVLITDLRMGQEPAYAFSFVVAEKVEAGLAAVQPTRQVGQRLDLDRGLRWLWQRMWGQRLPPPR
jgi:inner membrane protein